MSINFPTSLDTLGNPSDSTLMNNVTYNHATQHANANDAIEALEAKVGINSSAVTTSLDYRVATLEETTVTGLVLNDTASAVANTVAIQAALDIGGTINILEPGVIYLAYALIIGSNTKLMLGKNTTLRMRDADNAAYIAISSLTSSGTTATVTTTSAHGLTGSKIMLIGGVQFSQDGYNGLWQMTVTGTTTLTYTLPASISSPAVGRGGVIRLTGPYMEVGKVDNLLRNKQFFSKQYTLTSPTVVGPLSVGSIELSFTLTGTPGWVAGDTLLIKGDTSRYLNGPHRILSSGAGTVSIEFFSTTTGFSSGTPAGTIVGSLCDSGIEIEGGVFDGNGVSADTSWLAHVLCFNKTSNLVIRNTKISGGLKYSIAVCNGWRPTVRDLFLATTSDGFHSMGPNWGVTIDGMTGSTNDDFIAHTSNDPEGSYQGNAFPRNAGASVDFPQGTQTLGHVGQGTVDLGGGELIGFVARNIRPTFQNLRILLSGADSSKAFNGMSGIVIDGLSANFVNQSYGGGSDNPQIVICGEPSANQTSIINDVSIRNWSVGGVTSGYYLVGFDDHNVGGPYTGAQVVINNLDFDNVHTTTPLKGIDAESRFFSNSYDLMSIGKLSIRNSSFTFDTTTSKYALLAPNANNANGEYINLIVIDNCSFTHTAGTNDVHVLLLGGSSGSRIKSMTVSNSRFDSDVTSAFECFQFGNSGPTTKPVLILDSCTFKSVRFAVGSTGSLYALVLKGCSIAAATYDCMIYGSGSLASTISWSQNFSAGPLAIDGGLTGYTVLSGDSTLSIDLSKPSVSASKGAMAVSRSGNGTIGSGQLAISDGTNWRQVSDRTLYL